MLQRSSAASVFVGVELGCEKSETALAFVQLRI